MPQQSALAGLMDAFDLKGQPTTAVAQPSTSSTPQEPPKPEDQLSDFQKFVGDIPTPWLQTAQKYLVDPFEWLAHHGAEAGKSVATAVLTTGGGCMGFGHVPVPNTAPVPIEQMAQEHPILTGVTEGVGSVAGGAIADPRNWPFLARGAARPILQRLISGGFATMMGAGAISAVKNLHDNWDKLSPEQRTEIGTQAGLQGLMAAGASVHAARGKASVQANVMPDEQDSNTVAAEKSVTPEEGTSASVNAPNAVAPLKAPTPEAKPASNFAANINLEKVQTGEDVLNVIRQTAQDHAAELSQQARGVRSNVQTQQAADQLGLTSDVVSKMQPGTALNAEELLAARRINVATAEDVTSAAKDYAADPSDENLLRVQAAMQKHIAVLRAVSGATAEAGRALQQQKIVASGLQSGNYSKVLGQLGNSGVEITADIAQKLAAIPEDDTVALNNFLRNVTPHTTAEKVSSYWKANVLSSPRTVLRKVVGDAVSGVVQFS
jgi:hypothetical protein